MFKLIVGLGICLVVLSCCCNSCEAGKYTKALDTFVASFAELDSYINSDPQYVYEPEKYFKIIYKERTNITDKGAKNVLNLLYQLNQATKMVGQRCTDEIIEIIYLISEVTKYGSRKVDQLAGHMAKMVAKLCKEFVLEKLSKPNNLLTNPLTGMYQNFGKEEIESHSTYELVNEHWLHGPGFKVSHENMAEIIRLLAAGDPLNVYGSIEKKWNVFIRKKVLKENFDSIITRYRDTQCVNPRMEVFNEAIEQAYAIAYYSFGKDAEQAQFNFLFENWPKPVQDKIYRYYFCMIFYHLTPDTKIKVLEDLSTYDWLKSEERLHNPDFLTARESYQSNKE